MPELDERKAGQLVTDLHNFWEGHRNKKFREWFEILWMVDQLAAKGMESYVSNEPLTFYQMAHYLLTRGEISHNIPVQAESAADLDNKAKVHRGCEYMWTDINRLRKLGGNQSFIDDISFYMLILGWYSVVYYFDNETGLLRAQIWNPADTYPRFSNNKMSACVHTYKITRDEAREKAEANEWRADRIGQGSGEVKLDDLFIYENDVWQNMVIIDGNKATDWIERPEMHLLVSPVGGYPDRGSLTPTSQDWRELAGKGIFEINAGVTTHFNKWKSMVAQILRDTAQSIMQEFAANPKATPAQLRERGALFHYAPGERGLERVPPAVLPIEIQANLMELRREMQKGGFNDAVHGMVEGQPGYALSLLASSSANQVLYPYMDGKHFIISEGDKFWLSNLKTSKRVFDIKGKFIEKLSPTNIPEDVTVIVESDVATPKDWLERGTIGGMVRQDLDKATLLSEIYRVSDPQGVIRKKKLDNVFDHPMTQMLEMIASYEAHADYLDWRGDKKSAMRFRKAAQSLESQLGVPPAGQAKPEEMSEVQAERKEGTPAERPTVPSKVAPPETGGFTPQQLRRNIGRGQVRVA